MSVSERSNEKTLPTLQQLRREASLTSRQLAEAAGVPLHIEYLMEIGGHVKRDDALTILSAFSHLTGQTYSLELVQVNLIHEASQLSPITSAKSRFTSQNITQRKDERRSAAKSGQEE